MPAIARESASFDIVRFIDTVERFGRNFALLPMDEDRRRSFIAEAKQLAKVRRRIAEKDRYPLELRQYVAEAMRDLERFCEKSAFQLGRAYILRIAGIEIEEDGPNYTRDRSKLDSYVMLLASVWVNLGGDWWSKGLNTPEAKAFIAVCAEPVVGEESASMDAVGKRLQRLIRRGLAVWITFKMPDGRLEQCPITLQRTKRHMDKTKSN